MIQGSYNPESFESKWYKIWEKNNSFLPKKGDKENFSIVIPPPNVTGSLHMGHALQHCIIDVIIRRKRMQGYETLWLPGTDHAGIITQLLVENELESKGLSRQELGREKFLKEVWKWKEDSGNQISSQMKTLGVSCDWSRERFTMDEGLSEAVLKVFIDLYDKGLIYRGKRIVNWDPELMSAVSDLEVNNVEEDGFLWHIKYMLDGGDHLTIATTRPETLLGDTAVAVNPNDDRYSDLVGKDVEVPIVNRKVKIIADDYVDQDFVQGCVKITPSHDFNDYEIGERHNLELVTVLNLDGTIKDSDFIPSNLRGLDRYEARKEILRELKRNDLLIKEEKYKIQIPKGDRSGVILEPMVTDQWFVSTESLAKKAIDAVKNGDTNYIPKNWEKTYFEWLNNIQDWCISRQIWWGHRIPAWYSDDNIYVGMSEEDVRKKYKLDENIKLSQDEDVLDTWFSSALWPFSTFGWPEETEDLRNFYPTTLMVTGFDIIFFWVARMMMLGIEFMKDVPFKDILIHGLVRDSAGRKMSKSLGNTIDPLELADTYGADSLRLSLIQKASPGQDVPFNEEWVDASKKFGNKLWNAAKYIEINSSEEIDFNIELSKIPENIWIVNKFNDVTKEFDRLMEEYKISDAYDVLYSFLWSELFDWYFEFTKNIFRENKESIETQAVLREIFLQSLKLLNPAMPFVTEELWEKLGGDGVLINSKWPEIIGILDESSEEIELIKYFVSSIRNFRVDHSLKFSEELELISFSKLPDEWQINQISSLSKTSVIEGKEEKEKKYTSFSFGGITLNVDISASIDIESEKKRVLSKIKESEKSLLISKERLENKKFIENAKEELINQEKRNFEELTNKIEELNHLLKRLN